MKILFSIVLGIFIAFIVPCVQNPLPSELCSGAIPFLFIFAPSFIPALVFPVAGDTFGRALVFLFSSLQTYLLIQVSIWAISKIKST